MPFKSEAQRRLFHVLAAKGELSEETVHEWEHATKNKKKLPYHTKDASYAAGVRAALQHFDKTADHADDRLKERIKADLPANALKQLRAQTKNLELAPGRYYLPMKNKAGTTAAIAAFKTVGPKNELVLATVLAPKNKPPPGTSLSHLLAQPRGEKITEVAASPKTYTLRKNPDGRLTCTCKSFKFHHRAAGTDCKHIKAHLEH